MQFIVVSAGWGVRVGVLYGGVYFGGRAIRAPTV